MPFYNSCDLRGNAADYLVEMLPKFSTKSAPRAPAPCTPQTPSCQCAPKKKQCSSYAQETMPLYVDFQWNSVQYQS